MCLSLRRSIVAESASAVVIIARRSLGLALLVAGEGEEDVVEVGGVHGQFGDVDAMAVEVGEDAAQFRHAAAGWDRQGEGLLVGLAGPCSASPAPAPPNDRLGPAERFQVGEP